MSKANYAQVPETPHEVKVKLRGTCGICGNFDINMSRRYKGGRYFQEMCHECHARFFPRPSDLEARDYSIDGKLNKFPDIRLKAHIIELVLKGEYSKHHSSGTYEIPLTLDILKKFKYELGLNTRIAYFSHALVNIAGKYVYLIGYQAIKYENL